MAISFGRIRDPQVVTGSHDSTIKFWSLRYWKTMATLTHHKKSVRAMALHPKKHAFASALADNRKKFTLPKGEDRLHLEIKMLVDVWRKCARNIRCISFLEITVEAYDQFKSNVRIYSVLKVHVGQTTCLRIVHRQWTLHDQHSVKFIEPRGFGLSPTGNGWWKLKEID
ncbi:pleiotropic regulatory locus 1-like protein [Drosera capensis]